MNKVILAPAGGKKTQTIIDMCCEDGTPKEILILTYTTTGQKVIQDRLWKSKSVNNHIEVPQELVKAHNEQIASLKDEITFLRKLLKGKL